MRFIRGVVIASWKLLPIPCTGDLKYGPHVQFVNTPTGVEISKNKIVSFSFIYYVEYVYDNNA